METMTTKTARIKNGSVALPKELQKSWKGADVYISGGPDTISIKRLSRPRLDLQEMLNEFRQAAKKTNLSQKTTAGALRKARKELYA